MAHGILLYAAQVGDDLDPKSFSSEPTFPAAFVRAMNELRTSDEPGASLVTLRAQIVEIGRGLAEKELGGLQLRPLAMPAPLGRQLPLAE
jgi:hypothetical protein